MYRDSIEQVVGFLHLRKVLNLMTQKPDFNRADLEKPRSARPISSPRALR